MTRRPGGETSRRGRPGGRRNRGWHRRRPDHRRRLTKWTRSAVSSSSWVSSSFCRGSWGRWPEGSGCPCPAVPVRWPALGQRRARRRRSDGPLRGGDRRDWGSSSPAAAGLEFSAAEFTASLKRHAQVEWSTSLSTPHPAIWPGCCSALPGRRASPWRESPGSPPPGSSRACSKSCAASATGRPRGPVRAGA